MEKDISSDGAVRCIGRTQEDLISTLSGDERLLTWGVWRNGSASDSRSEGWEFESLCPHVCASVGVIRSMSHSAMCSSGGRCMIALVLVANFAADAILRVRQLVAMCICTTARGFEPLRAEPNGFLVHHLNHSVTLSCFLFLCLRSRADDVRDADVSEDLVRMQMG